MRNGNEKTDIEMPRIVADERRVPPQWALLERRLFDALNQAAVEFANRYAREDGTLVWRGDWPGMDGSDDPYEGFMYLSLLYTLGGSDEAYRLARRIYEGITWQWTQYGQIHREFDAYYDWMHHGEGYLFFYFLGLTDPASLKDRQRAERFARMYTGEDPEAPNYDPERKLIRSPITGSRGPRFEMTEEDWVTHREVLDDYHAPFEDIPGVDFASGKCPWSDDEIYPRIIQAMNERMAKGDVPLNLNATSLIAHACMYSGDESLRRWVEEYVGVWAERARNNGGVIPDNVGLSGEIGEYLDGKWWGGYYGWRWPHGFLTIIEPVLNGAMNAVLLTGDMKHLDMARGQIDEMWKRGREENGQWVVPHKHYDGGWTDFKPANPLYPIYLWYTSMEDEDLDRVLRVSVPEHSTYVDVPTQSGTGKNGKNTKHFNANWMPWFEYIRGERADYPERILEANFELMNRQLAKMRSEAGDPRQWIGEGPWAEDINGIHKWQEMCPVYFEGLLQLTLGAPMHLSHGGLQHARVRYFDAERRRPGLPEDVAALVEKLEKDGMRLTLVNVSLFEAREVVVQAGSFGEHAFESAAVLNEAGEETARHEIGGKYVRIRLLPGAGATLDIRMSRYANRPSYDTPWRKTADGPAPIAGRPGYEA
ncbi:hypothetical protein FE782_16300 [Paenibacillus antri]|uniref:Uncharacterized protein n=1 Tax=Paenibacillus antri TaxID=2582848 RepID=A0A5R9GD37_9BACL|nr:hypothetical protein [Paenibacillus antri]TLS51288.1 hypothetical protein FE782_16300 [Paenibacillus antri]